MVRGLIAGTIAGKLLGGCAQRNLKTGSGIRIGGRDIVSLREGRKTGKLASHSIKIETMAKEYTYLD
jgi:hypothetical protein